MTSRFRTTHYGNNLLRCIAGWFRSSRSVAVAESSPSGKGSSYQTRYSYDPVSEPEVARPAKSGLTDLLLVQYLVQETERAASPLQWKESDGGRLRCEINGVRLELQEIQTRSGRYLSLKLSSEEQSTELIEEFNRHLFGAKDEHREVAELLHRLEKLAIAQCVRRQEEALRNRDQSRQLLYRKVVLGDCGPAVGD